MRELQKLSMQKIWYLVCEIINNARSKPSALTGVAFFHQKKHFEY